ncbi:MAG: esterase/lipase family protein [Marmoricola sp.]
MASFLIPVSSAQAGTVYAPLSRPGPALDVSATKLAAALTCHGSPTSGGEPVLLSPGTSVTAEQNFSWNYEKAFTAQHRYWCAVSPPYHTLGDIQVAAEYLVYGIRRMHHASGRRIAVMGHSQGGMSMRWGLRFWPDTRTMVDDIIGMAGDNHGSTALAGCIVGLTTCMPSIWQQGANAHFIKALNSGTETFAGISYTEIYTTHDEVVTPSTNNAVASSALHTGAGAVTNIATQSICPAEPDEHLTVGTIDPVTYALVMDALTHAGPARPSRINRAVCGTLYMPYVDPASVPMYLLILEAAPNLATVSIPNLSFAGAPLVAKEPALRCYVYAAGCR